MKLSDIVSYKYVVLVKFTANTLSPGEIVDSSKLKDRASKWWVANPNLVKDVGHLIVSYEGSIIAAYNCGSLDSDPKENVIYFREDDKGHMRIKLQLSYDNTYESRKIIGYNINDKARWPFRVISTDDLYLFSDDDINTSNISVEVDYEIGAGGTATADFGNRYFDFSLIEQDENDQGDVVILADSEDIGSSSVGSYNRNSLDHDYSNPEENRMFDEYQKNIIDGISESISSIVDDYLSEDS